MFDQFLGSRANFGFIPSLTHADLGPAHVLCAADGTLAGVIDWSDSLVGDPALDLSWPLNGPPGPFGDRLLSAYDLETDDAFLSRALFYHRMGPWHEVVYGLYTDQSQYVASGLDGVRARLPLVVDR